MTYIHTYIHAYIYIHTYVVFVIVSVIVVPPCMFQVVSVSVAWVAHQWWQILGLQTWFLSIVLAWHFLPPPLDFLSTPIWSPALRKQSASSAWPDSPSMFYSTKMLALLEQKNLGWRQSCAAVSRACPRDFWVWSGCVCVCVCVCVQRLPIVLFKQRTQCGTNNWIVYVA